MDALLAWRKEFPILSKTTYLISHSLGAMPRRTAEALQEFSEIWASRGIRAWEEGWWEMPVTLGNLIGSIIGAGPGDIVMHQNVSICQSLVTSCFDWNRPRNKLVTDGLNFPSNDYIYYGLERHGARVCRVASPDGMTLPLELMHDAIDEQTQLVSLSHVAFRSSFVQDLGAITRRAHEMGALVFADLYQSAGTVPVDVRALGLDFATGGSVKWLCGGPRARASHGNVTFHFSARFLVAQGTYMCDRICAPNCCRRLLDGWPTAVPFSSSPVQSTSLTMHSGS